MTNTDMVIVRASGSGVWFGRLVESPSHEQASLVDARRIRYWKGAVDCSDLAANGVTDPDATVMLPPVTVTVFRPAEVLTCTEQAIEVLSAVKVRTEHNE